MRALDEALFRFFFGFSGRSAALDGVFVFIAEYLPYALALAFIVLVFDERGWRKRMFRLLQASLTLLVARGILTETIRYVLPRERPFSALGVDPLIAELPMTSFPSGHAVFMFALAAVTYHMNRKWGIAYFAAAAVVGFSRIAVGVHWPSDILAGAALGAFVGFLLCGTVLPGRALSKDAPEHAEKEDN